MSEENNEGKKAPKGYVLKTQPGVFNITGGIPTLSTRANLSVWHILAAAEFARKAGEIENINAGKSIGDFYQEIASNVMASVFFSVAALEANINELFKDSHKHIPELNLRIKKEFWNLIERKTILEKYDYVLVLKGKKRLDKKLDVYKNIDNLILLRNRLVHFHPEWSTEQKKHKTVQEKLTGKFQLSPFLSEGDTFFPKRIMSHGCAEWAVKTVLDFVTHFSSVSGLADSFAPYDARLKTN